MSPELVSLVLRYFYKKYSFLMIAVYLLASVYLVTSQFYQAHFALGLYILIASLLSFVGVFFFKLSYWYPIRELGWFMALIAALFTLPPILLFSHDVFEIANLHISVTLWFLIGFVITLIFWNRANTMRLTNLGAEQNGLRMDKNIKSYLDFLNSAQPNDRSIYDLKLLPNKKSKIKTDLEAELRDLKPIASENCLKDALIFLAQFQKGVGPVCLTRDSEDTFMRYEELYKQVVKEREEIEQDIATALRHKEEYRKSLQDFYNNSEQ